MMTGDLVYILLTHSINEYDCFQSLFAIGTAYLTESGSPRKKKIAATDLVPNNPM